MSDVAGKQLAEIKYAIDQAAIVATTDVHGRITYANDKFCEISGYSRDELMGRDHRLLNSGLHPASFMKDLWQTIARGHVWHGEIRNRAKDGHVYWVDTTIVPFLDDRGHPYQYIAIRSDITAKKAAEERLREQAALARVGQMAAVVAHEVKNPLAGIKGVMQVLMSRRAAADPELAVMADIVQRIDALSDLIQDLLLFTRPRALRVNEFDLGDLLAHSVAVLKDDASTGGVAVTVEASPIVVAADRDMLHSAFLNLLLNATQAMGGHGRITVTARVAAGRCTIDIADTGPGIPPDLRARVFEPFFTTRSRGNGLGLPVARRTMELHGGTVTLSCPETGGTVIHIDLPVRPAIPPGAPNAASVAAHGAA